MSIPQWFPHFICAVLLFLWLLINVYWSKGQYLHLKLHKYGFKSWYRYSVRAWAGANLERSVSCTHSGLDIWWKWNLCSAGQHQTLPLTIALWPWHWHDQVPAKCELHQTLPLWGWDWRTNAEPKAILITYCSTNLCQAIYRQQKDV